MHALHLWVLNTKPDGEALGVESHTSSLECMWVRGVEVGVGVNAGMGVAVGMRMYVAVNR